MPPPNVAGHQPKKITMNKFGGGITNFGSNYGARAQQPGWSPQPSIYSQQYTPQLSTQEREGTASQYQQQVIIYSSRVRMDFLKKYTGKPEIVSLLHDSRNAYLGFFFWRYFIAGKLVLCRLNAYEKNVQPCNESSLQIRCKNRSTQMK